MQRLLLLLTSLVAISNATAQIPVDQKSPLEQPAKLRDPSFLVGHNLTATSDVLEGRHCTVGLQVFACRVGEKTAIGSSTWMLLDYNMISVAIRHLISEDSEGNRWAGQVSYFQTYKQRSKAAPASDDSYNYQMTSVWLQAIRTYQVRDDYRLHLNLDLDYYFDDVAPFSLRRPSFDNSPVQINISSLHQVALFRGWFMLGELGLLDVTRGPLHTHSGVSIGAEGSWWSWHLGYSLTAGVNALFSPGERVDYQQVLHSQAGASFHQSLDPMKVEYDYAIHPEFALQFVF